VTAFLLALWPDRASEIHRYRVLIRTLKIRMMSGRASFEKSESMSFDCAYELLQA
jgi:transposase